MIRLDSIYATFSHSNLKIHEDVASYQFQYWLFRHAARVICCSGSLNLQHNAVPAMIHRKLSCRNRIRNTATVHVQAGFRATLK